MAEKAFGGLSNIVIWGMKDVPILRLILYLEKCQDGGEITVVRGCSLPGNT